MAQNYDPQDSNKENNGIAEERKPENPVGLSSGLLTAYTNPSYYPARPAASNIFAKWLLLLTHPNVKTYAEEGYDADLFTAVLNALLLAAFIVIYALVDIIILSGLTVVRDIFPLLLLALLSMAASTIGLFIGSGIIYLLAKTLAGGRGNFTSQTYLFSMYNIPIAIISTILGSFGLVGTIAGYVVGIYGLVLSYCMIRAVHQISPIRTVLVVVGYVVVGVLLLLFILLPMLRASLGL